MFNNTIIIAEVKPKSPTFDSGKSWDELFELASGIGDWISIHTNPLWGGSFDLISKAKSKTDKPILAKGFHDTDEEVKRAVKLGADFVLVVGRIPNVHRDKCIIEPYDLPEFMRIPDEFKSAWNSRDLKALRTKTESKKKENFADVRAMRPDIWLCQASNLVTMDDIVPGADAVLVGTNLESFGKSLP
ncbi:MAG: hypothetical protein WC761_04205 [Candidatus Paceibacterota bacterium]|jgi:indole-3-glycerol phosphate synthase